LTDYEENYDELDDKFEDSDDKDDKDLNDNNDDKYEPKSLEESTQELKGESFYDPEKNPELSSNDAGLEIYHDIRDFENVNRVNEPIHEVEPRQRDIGEQINKGHKNPKIGSEGKELKGDKKDKKKDKKKKEKIRVKKIKVGKIKAGKIKSSDLKGIKNDIKDLKKKIMNKSFLMKTDEELARELTNKKYRRVKNLEDIKKHQR
jgi:hypothetical protein